MVKFLSIFGFLMLAIVACKAQNSSESIIETVDIRKSHHFSGEKKQVAITKKEIEVGALQLSEYLPLLQNKTVALVVNQTSVINSTHLLDTLISLGINVKKVFAPEHGFRGTADAGEHINNGVDTKTNTPIVSLYGNNKKPSTDQLSNVDIVLFDIQDVGVRFYTYISTLQYVMEACAENNKALIVLDRPNPNGYFVDGPVLEKTHQSFVGMQQIPIVYGMTIGEYAQFLNGEKLLENGVLCNLTVIPCKNYDHNSFYELPIKPSPNLPNMASIYLYPSLCFFEGTTNISLGRGTDKPFQIYGSNDFSKNLPFSFTPVSTEGAKYPPLQNKLCYGYDLSSISIDSLQEMHINLDYLLNAYQMTKSKNSFFNDFFVKLAGTNDLKNQIKNGNSANQIKATWQNNIDQFKVIRKKYLLYKDFE
ncbi:MAG: DUF1343 domain-containing protein [Chitinophagales bacterium]|nr:DUF1343 domain-containing protein [Chitinophagales bacterium]